MKLTKSKLISLVKKHLEKIDFIEFKDTITSAQGLFGKKLDNGYYLTLGLIIHRMYDSQFTGSFYLSRSMRWASMWGDIPRDSYKRPGYFLSIEERSKYNNILSNSNSLDIWWDAGLQENITDFVKIIKLTENRFVNQDGLLEKIDRSIDINEMIIYSRLVKSMVTDGIIYDQKYNYTPVNQIDDIPIEWFKASEIVLMKQRGILNMNTVKLLAADSFRQDHLDKL